MLTRTTADGTFEEALDAYLDAKMDEIIGDIATLVAIPSVEDTDHAAPAAPFGPGPARALAAALDIAHRLGLAPVNGEGYVGFADLPAGREPAEGPRKTICIIGHVDVVAPGPGWAFEAWNVTRHEGYLVGRGVLDDKGPLMVALHALHFLHELGKQVPEEALPYDTRVIFGANEETSMEDVAYYREHFEDPDFLFTPDAEFPVGYGEKGIFQGWLVSRPILPGEGGLVAIAGGAAMNAVPGPAGAQIRGYSPVVVVGQSAHAAKPYGGVSAIVKLIDTLVDGPYATTLSSAEIEFLTMCARVTRYFDGRSIELESKDDMFGPLTLVGGTIGMEPAPEAGEEAFRLVQGIDIRFPTSITSEHIRRRLADEAASAGATLREGKLEEPYLTAVDGPELGALLSAYRSVSGDDEAEPFTMGGGTYARRFPNAVSFGMERPWIEEPAWVGSMHGPDEAVSIEALKLAFKVYATALRNLAQL
ncbi:MAG: M20/M25/M40 family metallo-hydrolase [Eggerthellaceae bacterium]|nr:M20/M25/M40 family metallo-hydrolase [Eggerthellaceae bacterium]